MIAIQLVTRSDWALLKEATLRVIKGAAKEEISGVYENDRWIFNLSINSSPEPLVFQFVMNRQMVESLEIKLDSYDGETYTYYASQFPASDWTRLGPIPDFGHVNSREFDLAPKDPKQKPFDVIVIGSGMAGGVLAERLSDNKVRTLVLEAGGVPLETHIANLPRSHRSGFQKHVWQRWSDFGVRNYENGGPNNKYDGRQGFNLGGRSVFWGGFIPRMTSPELDFWPQQLKWDLEDRYYAQAEELMGLSIAPFTSFSRSIHRLLREELSDYVHFDAPVAVRPTLTGSNTISTGMFSTADLLLESHRTKGPLGNDFLSIRTHQLAIQIIRNETPDVPCTVITRDILTGTENRFEGKYVVLSCGCLESARLAKRSGLGNKLVGHGITDHPIAFTHFEIPPFQFDELDQEGQPIVIASPYYDRYGTVKIVSQAKKPENHHGIYNVLIELGADFNQGRFIDPEIIKESEKKRSMLCEIVFLTNLELVQDNSLEFQKDNDFRPSVNMQNPGLTLDLVNELTIIRDKVIKALGGSILNQGWGDGSLGFVAHEVGSLRMQVMDSNNVMSPSRLTGKKQPKITGVVDDYGKFLDEERIYACDLSIFPTSPAANPSLTAVALAMRLSDELVRLLKVTSLSS